MSNLKTLGVLFVHGIGEQRPGQTLTQFGDVLVRWLEREAVGVVVDKAVLTAGDGDSAPANASISFDYQRQLAPPELQDVDPEGTERQKHFVQGRWIFAEGLWADALVMPSFVEMLRWVLRVLPSTVLTHFDRWLRRTWITPGTRGLDSLISRTPRVLSAVLLLVLVLLLVPVLAGVLLIVLLLGLVPIPAVRGFSASAQRLMAATLGDSMILLESPIQHAAIVEKVHRAYQWLEGKCDTVAIVAHSQGAAIAHEMLRERQCAKARLFVSFGSGIAKLKEVRDSMDKPDVMLWIGSLCALGMVPLVYALLDRIGAQALVFVGAVVGLALGLALVVNRTSSAIMKTVLFLLRKRKPKQPLEGCLWEIGVMGTTAVIIIGVALAIYLGGTVLLVRKLVPSGTALQGLAIAFGVLFGIVIWSLLTRSKIANTQLLPAEKDASAANELPSDYQLPASLQWIDIYSESDPISNGPIVIGMSATDRFDSYQSDNRASFLLDHNAYWRNPEQFVSRVGTALLRIVGIQRDVDPWLERVSARRTLRTRALKEARTLVVFIAVGLSVTWWNVISAFAHEHRHTFSRWLKELPLIGGAVSGVFTTSRTPTPIALALILVAIAVVYQGVSVAWLAWDYGASDGFRKDDPDKGTLARPLFYGIVFALFVVMTALLSVRIWSGTSPWRL